MTTAAYNRTAPFSRAALVAVKKEHCSTTSGKPPVDVHAEMPCPRCGSRVKYYVPAATGYSNGRCVASCGVEWRE